MVDGVYYPLLLPDAFQINGIAGVDPAGDGGGANRLNFFQWYTIGHDHIPNRHPAWRAKRLPFLLAYAPVYAVRKAAGTGRGTGQGGGRNAGQGEAGNEQADQAVTPVFSAMHGSSIRNGYCYFPLIVTVFCCRGKYGNYDQRMRCMDAVVPAGSENAYAVASGFFRLIHCLVSTLYQ